MPRTWLISSCLIAALGVFIFPLSIVPAETPVPAVKLIEYGWDTPKPILSAFTPLPIPRWSSGVEAGSSCVRFSANTLDSIF
jgi:hypothetical protein